MKLASSQHRFEKVTGIHGRAFSPAGAHHIMQFIDEEDDLTL